MKRPTPEEYEKAFERIAKSAPNEKLNDPDFKKTTLMLLSLGGENLARQYIEIYGKSFPERLTLFDRPLEDETLKESSEEEEESEEEPDEDETD